MKNEGASHKSLKLGDSASPHGNRGKGRPKGCKNKRTLVKEAVAAIVEGKVAAGKVTPLEAMILLVEDARLAYAAAVAAPPVVDDDGEKARLGAIRRARQDLLEAAQAAAPYLHAKLSSIDQRTQGNLTVVLESVLGDEPPAA